MRFKLEDGSNYWERKEVVIKKVSRKECSYLKRNEIATFGILFGNVQG